MAPHAAVEELRGAVDLHVHTAPDVFPRLLDDFEAIRQARAAGLRAVCLKNHFFPTSDRALLAQRTTGFTVLGGIALNFPVGGLNPDAVDMAVRGGARIVWMPTVHSAATVSNPDIVSMFRSVVPAGRKGLTLVEGGTLRPEVEAVLEILATRDVVLATGHVSPFEVDVVVRRAVRVGVKRIILTHPFSSLVGMTTDAVRALTGLSDGVFVEFACHDCYPHMQKALTYEAVRRNIAVLGPSKVIITSDGGQTYNPPPVEMLSEMAAQLRPHFAPSDLRAMFAENPARAAGLDCMGTACRAHTRQSRARRPPATKKGETST